MNAELQRCTGHCCRAFVLTVNMTPEEMNSENSNNLQDIDHIRSMVIFRGLGWWDSEELTFISVDQVPDWEQQLAEGKCSVPKNYFTCKHFDEKTNNCMDYENRPKMCSNYPYGGPCSYQGCTYRNVWAKDDVVEKRIEREGESNGTRCATA